MKGWSKTTNRGKSGARKKQTAHGDHSVSRVKQKKAGAPKEGSLGFGGNKTQGLTNRPMPDNIGGKIKAPREGCGD